MLDTPATGAGRRGTRANLVEVAAQLLREQGPTGVTTRAVAQAAGVQAPTIYRLFGDKDGLLDAVAEHVFATGAVLTLLALPPQDRELDLADAMYDAVAWAILTDVPTLAEDSTTPATVAFQAIVPKLSTLTEAERALLAEWLDRATDG